MLELSLDGSSDFLPICVYLGAMTPFPSPTRWWGMQAQIGGHGVTCKSYIKEQTTGELPAGATAFAIRPRVVAWETGEAGVAVK